MGVRRLQSHQPAAREQDHEAGDAPKYLAVLILFLLCLSALYAIFHRLPHMSPEHAAAMRLPRSMKDVFEVQEVLSTYMSQHSLVIWVFYVSTFIFIQSFAIPGSIPLAVLGGALFGTELGVATAGVCTALGSTNCYLLSWVFAKSLVQRYGRDQLQWWQQTLDQHQTHLFSTIFVLRLTPIFPGWFLNMAAPHVGIPLRTFFLATFCGILPTSFLYARAGDAIEKMATHQEIEVFTPANVAALVLISVLVLLPSYTKSMFPPTTATTLTQNAETHEHSD